MKDPLVVYQRQTIQSDIALRSDGSILGQNLCFLKSHETLLGYRLVADFIKAIHQKTATELNAAARKKIASNPPDHSPGVRYARVYECYLALSYSTIQEPNRS